MYRLALVVGEYNVEDDGGLADRVTAWQLMRWSEYDRCEPWGPERGDLRAGIVAATVANTVRGKGARPFKPADFMPQFGGNKQTPSQVAAVIGAYFRAVKMAERK